MKLHMRVILVYCIIVIIVCTCACVQQLWNLLETVRCIYIVLHIYSIQVQEYIQFFTKLAYEILFKRTNMSWTLSIYRSNLLCEIEKVFRRPEIHSLHLTVYRMCFGCEYVVYVCMFYIALYSDVCRKKPVTHSHSPAGAVDSFLGSVFCSGKPDTLLSVRWMVYD